MSAWIGLISGAHAIIAMRRGEPHWLLTEADAKTYGGALHNAMRHLPIGVTQKALDFTALAVCVINMETPRVYASAQMRRARRRQAQQQPSPGEGATVFQFRPPPPETSAAADPTKNGAGGVEGFTGDGIDAPIGGH